MMDDGGQAGRRPQRRVWTWLFNPFHYLAGGQALGIGVIIIAAAAVVGAASRSHFDGVLDFHTGLEVPPWVFLVEGLIDWLALGILLLAAGKLVSRTHVRALDVFGTQALARAPMLLTAAAALLPGFRRVTDELGRAVLRGGALWPLEVGAQDVVVFALVLVVALVMLVWMVALMYRAYAVSCNVTGARAIISFIVALLLAEAASKAALIPILTAVAPTP
jgi:hypothetical protein